jgi:hypothetical protein
MSQGTLREVGQGGKEQQGSPRMAEAVRLYFDHPSLTAVQALKLADFSKNGAESGTKQKTLLKRRRNTECALRKENKRRAVHECWAMQRTSRNHLASIDVQSVSNLSGLTDDEAQETDAASSTAASSTAASTISNSTTRRAVLLPSNVSNTNANKCSLPFDRRKGLARKSPRTPQQKAAFEAERRIAFKAKNADYSWAVEKDNLDQRDVDSNRKSIQYWATEANQIFGLDVKSETVQKMIFNGNVCLQSPGPGMVMGAEAHSFMGHAILSNINLCQRNGDT